jgi:hypothetical protein
MESVKEAAGDFDWTRKTPSPPSPPDSNAKEATDSVVSDSVESKMQTRKITKAHFAHAINVVHASLSTGSRSELYQWHETHGRKKTLAYNNNDSMSTTSKLSNGYSGGFRGASVSGNTGASYGSYSRIASESRRYDW